MPGALVQPLLQHLGLVPAGLRLKSPLNTQEAIRIVKPMPPAMKITKTVEIRRGTIEAWEDLWGQGPKENCAYEFYENYKSFKNCKFCKDDENWFSDNFLAHTVDLCISTDLASEKLNSCSRKSWTICSVSSTLWAFCNINKFNIFQTRVGLLPSRGLWSLLVPRVGLYLFLVSASHLRFIVSMSQFFVKSDSSSFAILISRLPRLVSIFLTEVSMYSVW